MKEESIARMTVQRREPLAGSSPRKERLKFPLELPPERNRPCRVGRSPTVNKGEGIEAILV
jgi:hypothetical protein